MLGCAPWWFWTIATTATILVAFAITDYLDRS